MARRWAFWGLESQPAYETEKSIMENPDPQEALRNGDLAGCRAALIAQVKAAPGDAGLRAFLSQLCMLEGDWDRALKQLDMLGELDATALDLVTDYRSAILAERVRGDVMTGRATPSILGEPRAWIAKLVEALRLDAEGAAEAAYELRNDAFAEAPASPGEADGTRFDWLADADQRYGPVLEAVMDGAYHWIPFDAVAEIAFEPPRDLRDRVWTVGIMTLVNGGQWPILVPTRYPGSEIALGGEAEHALARRTDWSALYAEHYAGLGQRMFAAGDADLPLLDVRSIAFDHGAEVRGDGS